MSRYIDADALKETIDREIFRHDTIDHVFQIIDDAPSIDIVRCKECKWYERPELKITLNCCRDMRLVPMKPTDFCSYGERAGE